jgi:hypothetical protein
MAAARWLLWTAMVSPTAAQHWASGVNDPGLKDRTGKFLQLVKAADDKAMENVECASL